MSGNEEDGTVITYPPEMLPTPDEDDAAEVYIRCADGELRLLWRSEGSEMSETVPEDVMRTASEAYDAYANGDWRDIRECIARAIMAERERCYRLVYCGCENSACVLDEAAERIKRGDQP